jgi:hypothetical protein
MASPLATRDPRRGTGDIRANPSHGRQNAIVAGVEPVKESVAPTGTNIPELLVLMDVVEPLGKVRNIPVGVALAGPK